MGVCRELGITLAQGMEMSVYELKCWAGFFKLENERAKEQMNNGGRRNHKSRR